MVVNASLCNHTNFTCDNSAQHVEDMVILCDIMPYHYALNESYNISVIHNLRSYLIFL